jgi:hypothetical protein
MLRKLVFLAVTSRLVAKAVRKLRSMPRPAGAHLRTRGAR